MSPEYNGGPGCKPTSPGCRPERGAAGVEVGSGLGVKDGCGVAVPLGAAVEVGAGVKVAGRRVGSRVLHASEKSNRSGRQRPGNDWGARLVITLVLRGQGKPGMRGG
jgi:hypothetical protein